MAHLAGVMEADGVEVVFICLRIWGGTEVWGVWGGGEGGVRGCTRWRRVREVV